jgi:hypothetical protein
MNTIKTAAEDLAVAIIANIRNVLTPVFDKYTAYYKYVNFFIYGVYAVVLFGFYNTVPEYIPLLRNAILYTAVVILLLRFNTVSWTNPKFSILGGTTFSEFDRRLIISTCVFILITHIVSETVINYTKNQFQKRLIQPVSGGVIHPIYNIIDGAGAAAKAAIMPMTA